MSLIIIIIIITAEAITVSSECSCPSSDWYTTLRSYHSGVEGHPLAASPATHTVQNGDAGAQVPK